MSNKLRGLIVMANIAALLGVLLLFVSQVLQPLELKLYDYNVQQSLTGDAGTDRIIVVGIDERSLSSIGGWPWDRQVYAQFLDQVNQTGYEPAAIAFDLLFTYESNPQSDAAFAAALAKYDNVIIPSSANLESRFTRHTVVDREEWVMAQSLTPPIPALDAVSHDAHINALLDSDGVVRRTWLMLNTPERGPVASLALQAARMAGATTEPVVKRHPQAELLIRYPAVSMDYWNISFVDVIEGRIPPEVFTDAVVLIGFNAVGYENDVGITPAEKQVFKVYVHAAIVQQLLEGRVIDKMSPWTELMLILILSALMMFVVWKWRAIWSILAFLVLIACLYFAQDVAYRSFDLVLNAVHPFIAMVVLFIVNLSIKSYHESKQRTYITKQFGRYLSPDLVKQIALSGQEIQLGGINKELSILFLDIRGFTTLSERLKPEEVVDFLNMMFNLITEKALENKGTIDKFIGDAAMIVFNAPLDVERHEYYAVKTAYDIQQGMMKLCEEIQRRFDVTVQIGIGVHTGMAVIGNIGSYLRVDYTAIGDNVNIAARIESNTEAGQILVSADTYERTAADFHYTCIGERLMKGKSVPVKLYEVNGLVEARKKSSGAGHDL